MRRILNWTLSLAAVLGFTLLVPAGARANIGSGTPEACTDPSGPYTFTVTITVAQDGTPIASPTTNKNGTCVDGGDTIAFDVSGLPSGATWSATFPTPNARSLFANDCTFGNGANESSSCTVVSDPASATYSYTVTVNGKTLDPRVIIKSSARRKRHHRRVEASAPKATQP